MKSRILALFAIVFALALAAPSTATPVAASGKTIVDIAAGDARFSTLVAALQATGLDKVLASAGPFTVFAPTNDAFAKLPAGTIPALLKNPSALASILTYHVVSGAVPASTVVKLSSATTVNGAPVVIQVIGGNVILNGSVKVIITDIQASNGIIHVIDTVLLPPAKGLNQLYLINSTVNVLNSPAGGTTGLTIPACKTVYVSALFQNYGQLRDFGSGWIDLGAATPVSASYGQTGGQAIAPGCVGK